MDTKNNNLVWHGWGTRIVDNSDIDLTEQGINDAVYKIMKAFLPAKK
jgi:hypothetical protein